MHLTGARMPPAAAYKFIDNAAGACYKNPLFTPFRSIFGKAHKSNVL
jgi:hypothetical protein